LKLQFETFLVPQSLSKTMNLNKKEFLEDLTLLIIKNYLPMLFVESIWLK
jgi:hypothetical protein